MKYRYTVQQLQKMEQCRYLTDRERRVFNLVCRRGWAIEDAAAELYLSRSSVNASLSALREHPAMKALGVFDEAGNVDIDKI